MLRRYAKYARDPFGRIQSAAFVPVSGVGVVPGTMAGMGHWVYVFSGCPGSGDYQQIADDAEPGDVALRGRPGGLGIMDAFVRESVDDLMMVARFRWVASADPCVMTPAVSQTSAPPPLTRQGPPLVRTGTMLDAGESA